MSALAGQVRAEVLNSSEALRNAAEETAQRSSETIEGLLKRMTEQVETSGASLRNAVSTSAEMSVDSLAGTGDRLRDELTEVLDNLGKTSVAIDQSVAAAGNASRRSRADWPPGSRSSSAPSAASPPRWRRSGVSAPRRRPTPERSRASWRSRPSSSRSTAQELSAQQETIDLALERRQTGIQKLIGELSERSAAFDAVLERFSANVEDSFGRAQARAQEISATLASASRGASVAVAGQFESIRDAAAKEREKTAQSLQAAIDQTNAHLSTALD